MGFSVGHMVMMKAPLAHLELKKGEVGVVVEMQSQRRQSRVEFHAVGKPSRTLWVPDETLESTQKPRDPAAEGRETLELRQLLFSLVGNTDSIAEAKEKASALSRAAAVANDAAAFLGCDVSALGVRVQGIDGELAAATEEIARLHAAKAHHHLVLIGPSTLKRCYIDLDRDEAVRRYLVEHERADLGDIPVSELDVGDTFSAQGVGPE